MRRQFNLDSNTILHANLEQRIKRVVPSHNNAFIIKIRASNQLHRVSFSLNLLLTIVPHLDDEQLSLYSTAELLVYYATLFQSFKLALRVS